MSELEIWNELGNIYYNTGAYDESIRAYTKAIELDQDCGQSYCNLASIYVNQGRHAEAISLLQKGTELLEKRTDKALLWNRLGDIYQTLSQNDNALPAYRKAIELDPDNVTFQDNMAKAESDSAQTSPESSIEGSKTIREADNLQENSTLSDLLVDGTARSESGETTTAGSDLIESGAVLEAPSNSSVTPKDPDAACWVFKVDEPASSAEEATPKHSPGSTPVILGSHILSEEPVKNVKASPSGQPEMDESTKARANALLQVGILNWRKMDYEKASQFLNTALSLTTEFDANRFKALCFNAIALVETDLGRVSEAIQAYERAAALDPEHIFPWNKLGILYGQLDRYEEAMAAFQKAIEHNPKDAVSWNGLGDVHHKLGRNEDAIAAYQLGNVFDKQGHEEDAITMHQVAFEADQGNPQIWKEMGNIYYDAEAYDDAINAYSKAIDLLDKVTDKALLWNRMGDAYQQLGDHDNAAAAYHKAAELDPANTMLQDRLPEIESAPGPLNTEADTKSPEPEGVAHTEIDLDSSQETGRTDDAGAEPEGPPNLPDSTEGPEPEGAYWVFRSRKPLRKSSRPAVQPSITVVEAAINSAKPPPAVALPRFADQALLNDHLLLDTHEDANVIVVEQSPKTEEAKEVDVVNNSVTIQNDQDSTALEAEPGAIESSDTRPVKIDALNLQANKAGNQTADQFEKNLHSLKNDIAAYQRVTEINPKNDRAWDALGNMYEAAGLHNEAIAAFEQAISLDTKKEVYHYHLGLAYAAQTHYEKAIQALQKVIELNPGYILAHCALAGYYRRINKGAEAEGHIAIARPTMENENEYNRACFESICGNTDQAIEFLKVALDKQQIQLDWVRSDPDLDFIRPDPRFEALLHKNGKHNQ